MDLRHSRPEAGFTLIEVLVTLAIIGVLVGMSLFVLPSMVTIAKADSGSSQAVSALRTCRELAITQRRNVEVAFEGVQRIVCRRREIDADGLVNTAGDDDEPLEEIEHLGDDGRLGTADDWRQPLASYGREIWICDHSNTLREIRVTVTYRVGGLQRQYRLSTYISNYS